MIKIHSLLSMIVISFSLSACQQNSSYQPPVGEGSNDPAGSGQEPVAPVAPNYATPIQQILSSDVAANSSGIPSVTAPNMRRISLVDAPADFRVAYVNHIIAWEHAARADDAKRQLDATSGEVIPNAIICEIIGCDANVIANRLQLEEAVRQDRALAEDEIRNTFAEVRRIAVSYGADLTILEPDYGAMVK